MTFSKPCLSALVIPKIIDCLQRQNAFKRNASEMSIWQHLKVKEQTIFLVMHVNYRRPVLFYYKISNKFSFWRLQVNFVAKTFTAFIEYQFLYL